ITGEGAAEEYTRDEPIPWMNLIISRGRALSAIYQKLKDKKVLANLTEIKSGILAAKFISILPTVEEALDT
ncbi:MAG: hypothetical protein QGH63_09265, partial [Rhodospirillales bacterium]|nr:hypothetical protein [Rhodospirillales bacterium]